MPQVGPSFFYCRANPFYPLVADLPQVTYPIDFKSHLFYNQLKYMKTENLQTLSGRLASIRRMMEEARAVSPIAVSAPALIAASKTQPEGTLLEAIALGVTQFGENRVQEAQVKWPGIKAAHPEVTLHLIGPLQSNKAADAVALFDVIQTIDRPKIADAVAAEIARQHRPVRCLIQVNTGAEEQKGGIAPRDLPALLDHCRATGLPIAGLMCIPPADANPAPHFALLKQLAGHHGLAELSMGMSEDAAVAIRLGATHVRIGTRLFGPRTAA